MKGLPYAAVSAVALALIAPAAAAQMYKCVDARGVTHYADQPLDGCKGAEVDIKPIAPLSGEVSARRRDLARDEADFKRRRIKREEADATERAAVDKRCAGARRELGALSAQRRIFRIDASGERVYVEDEAREERLARLRELLRSCP